MFKRAVSASVLLVLPLVSIVQAQNIADPMRPPGRSAIRVVPDGSASWKLTAILVSPQRRLAVINNRLVEVGNRVSGARVKAISNYAVELELSGGERLLLKPANYRVRRSVN